MKNKTNSGAYEQLRDLLHELFQMDRSEIDFGIYRIMNHLRADVNHFLEEVLPDGILLVEENFYGVDKVSKNFDLKEASKPLNVKTSKINLSDKLPKNKKGNESSKYKNLIEKEVFLLLYTFFSRYYSEGDFVSLRRYKEGVYAIPYEGEEVKLHWANFDQYYVKTSEKLRNYQFVTPKGNQVSFLVESDGLEVNNNKAGNGREYRFFLNAENPIDTKDDNLVIKFIYRLDDGVKKNQDAVNKETINQLSEFPEIGRFNLNANVPVEGRSEMTILEKHLRIFTAKNTFDYFIHKDLRKFLTRELDFFIKNEILQLDDLNKESSITEFLFTKISAVRRIAAKIIDFLSQIENFKKKLWLKKKFVLDTQYCVSLDKLVGTKCEDYFLKSISENENQLNEWISLFRIDKLEGYDSAASISYLKNNLNLIVDTKFFEPEFKYRVLENMKDFEEELDGILVCSENFQAMSLLERRYRGEISCAHIDPPYNTQTSGFLYKNGFQHSSWLSMMHERIKVIQMLLSDSGYLQCHIDENEYERLRLLIGDFGFDSLNTVVWDKRNPVNGSYGVANQHEYIIIASKLKQRIDQSSVNFDSMMSKVDSLVEEEGGVNESVRKKYKAWLKATNFSGGEKSYSNIDDDGRIFQSVGLSAPDQRADPKFHQPLIHPKTGKPCSVPSTGFSRTPETLEKMVKNNEILFGKDEKTQPRQKDFLTREKRRQLSSVIQNAKKGKNDISRMGVEFPYCHPVSLYEDLIATAGCNGNEIVLDCFSGSATTAHAVINLNRLDGKKRKFILIEMGDYFHDITKPRVLKSAYSSQWSEGIPEQGSSHGCFVKCVSLEQFEDTLNNLTVKQSSRMNEILEANPLMKEQYILNYNLESSCRDSNSIINIDGFSDPFSYALSITRNEVTETVFVDLIETFNCLLGLRLKEVNFENEALITVSGKNFLGESCLIIWRNTEKITRDDLDEWFKKNMESGMFDTDVVYANGDTNIGSLRPSGQSWQIRSIESEFKRLMFDEMQNSEDWK